MNKIILFLTLIFTICNVQAEKHPMSLYQDSRLKTIIYDKDDIYHIHTHFGIGTEVVLAPYETIKLETVFMGLDGVFHFHPKDHGFMLVPRTIAPKEIYEFNLSFDTNLRKYSFKLYPPHYRKKRRTADVIYRLTFEYPKDVIALAKEELEKKKKERKIEDFVKEIKPSLKNCKNINLNNFNFDYIAEGDMSLRPLEMFDDGNFTYIKMDEQASITTLNREGVEQVLNSHPGCGYTIIESVNKKIILTLDGDVVCITNMSYNKNRPKSKVKSAHSFFGE